MPHSLSALLTPTRTPNARLLKHWEGRIVSLVPVRHPHAHHMLACSLAGSHTSSLARFSGSRLPSCISTLAFFLSLAHLHTRFFPRALPLSLTSRLTCPLLFSFCTDLQFFLYPWPVSAGAESPQAHPAPLMHRYHDDLCARKKGRRRRSRNKCMHQCVCRKEEKKALHKRGDLFFTLLNASHLKSH